jgi:hypothetical protein
MQKLSGTILGKNNKSCRIFHEKSNKIGFDFSDVSTIFYRFYKNQKTHVLFKFQLFTKTTGIFCRFTTMPSLHTKHPGINSDLAMWPSGRWPARAAQFQRAPAAGSDGEHARRD